MRRLQQEKGMALLLVLVIITLLTSLLSEFAFSTLVDLRLTETFRDRTGAYYLARGGVEAGRIILQMDSNGYDHPEELWGQGVPSYPAGEGTFSIEIEDLSGRLNLNDVKFAQPGYHRFVALCEDVLALSTTEAKRLATSLLDWQNADPQFTSDDDSYYLQQQPPYARKAGPLDAVEELNLIKGFDATTVEKLKPFLRVFGGNNLLNINTASAELILAWQYFSQAAAEGTAEVVLSENDIANIIEYREQQPFEDLADLNKVDGSSTSWTSAWQGATVKGTVYRIRGEGQLNQGIRAVEAIVEKQGTQVKILSLRVE